jgi:thiamine kinase-like enzyme
MPTTLGLKVTLKSLVMNIDFTKCTLLENQGYSNENYKFINNKKTYLLRKFVLKDRDRELEFNIQKLAYKKGISAKPILLTKEYMVCEFLEGYHKEILTREDIKNIIFTIKKLHNIKLKKEELNLQSLFKTQTKELQEAFSTIQKYPKELVLCHNDLNAKNFIFSKKSLKLIDWEFATINDLYFDLATISIEFNLSLIDEAYMLANYFQRDGWKKDKLEAYKVIYRFLCKEWFEEQGVNLTLP